MDVSMQFENPLGSRYQILREAGRGGMATVYLAEDLKHGRKVAVKVLRPDLAHAVGATRFLREIEIAARLNHPNILSLHDSGEADGQLFYVMPWVEGESLRDRLEREKQLPLEDALQIARQVADALSYAHSLGVVHRDVKPENILFQAGHAIVSDFGIARAVSSAVSHRLTQTGVSIGTVAYMSPEQATGEADIDARSDIYSLACVLFEMLGGMPPYVGPTPQAVLARKAVDPVPSLRALRDTVPPAVEHAVERALAKQPADRFRTAHAFAEALSTDARVTTAGSRRSRFVRGTLAAGPLIVIALTAVAYAVFLLRADRETEPTTVEANFTRLTAAPGVELFPSLSPNGQWIVYAGEASGNRDIYLLSVGGHNPINLTEDAPEDDDQPVFSPDGELIAFRSSRDGGGIFVMGRTGEALRRVTRFGFRPAWSPDGTQIAFVTGNMELDPQNFLDRSELWLAGVHTGQLTRTEIDDAALPSWSPHGHRIAFTRHGPDVHVWTIAASGGEPVAVTAGDARNWSPAWSPDGRYLYFVSDRRGSMNLWRVRIDEESGRTLADPEAITTPATSVGHPSLSADGRQIVYSAVTMTSNIQRVSFDPRRGAIVGEPRWLTTGSQRWANPELSPDGRRLAFYSLVEPEGDLYLMGADGTGLRQLTSDQAVDRLPRWSPDGAWITFFSDRGGRLQVWGIRPDGSDLRQLTEVQEAELSISAWSPDQSRMAAGAVSREGAVYLFNPDTAWGDQPLEKLVPPPDSLAPFAPNAWSPDGEQLAGMIGFFDQGVVTYSMRAQAYRRLTDFGQWPVWLPDNRRLLFVSGGSAYYIVDRETQQVTEVFSASRDVIGPPALSRDARLLYYTRRVTEADIWLVTLQ